MEQEIRLGIIGPLWIRQTLVNCLAMFPSIKATYRLSDRLEDAYDFTEELADVVDVFLYSGRIPYKVGKSAVPAGIPAFYIPLKGSGLHQTLYLLKKQVDFHHISFDGIHVNYIERAKAALKETFTFELFPSSIQVEEAENIASHHERVFAAQPDTVVVTSLRIVYEALREKDIPVSWLVPSEDDTIVILERLLLAMRQRIDLERQIAIGKIRVESQSKLVLQLANKQQTKRRNDEIYRFLAEGTEEMEAFLTRTSETEFIFATTRGAFERITEGYKWMPMLTEAGEKFSIRLSAGVGFGLSALDAGRHADIALTQALDEEETSCYIVREDRSVFGPVDLIAPVKYQVSVTDKRLIQKAEAANMNAAHLEKVMATLNRNQVASFTAHDLANELAITPRSAHRILLYWLDANLVRIVGTEKMSSKGRPRQVFAFNEE